MKRKDINKELKIISKAISELKDQSQSILDIIELLDDCRGKRIFICGNGGSAGTSSHLVCDLVKTCNLDAICLNDNISLLTALTNDIGWEHVYDYQLETLARSGDVLIVLSVHGGRGVDVAGIQSKNLELAIDYANSIDMETIGLGGKDDSVFKRCNINIKVDSEEAPVVEPVHSVLCHMIPFMMKEL